MESGWTLLVVGMFTVFIVLLSVVSVARVLITITNRFGTTDKITASSGPTISGRILAVITAVVQHETKGTGIIQKIDKLKQDNE